MKIAILYGSSTGKTEAVADALQRLFSGSDVLGIADTDPRQMAAYDAVLVGTSTWGTGALQDDWARRLPEFPPAVLAGKTLAFFGLGDRQAFADTFCSAVAELKARFAPGAARVLGPDLLLDDDNQPHLTDGLVVAWASALKDGGLDGR